MPSPHRHETAARALDRPGVTSSPEGELLAPRLDRPDFGGPDRPRPDGEYVARLIVEPDRPEVARFLSSLEALCEEALASARRKWAALPAERRERLGALKENPLTRPFRDAETDAPSGEAVLRFATPATRPVRGARGRPRRPVVFDSAGRPFWGAPVNLDGQTAKIAFRPFPYFLSEAGVAGLKLALVAVMLTAPSHEEPRR